MNDDSTNHEPGPISEAEIVCASAESPCVQICTIEGDICIGCGRTLEEIGAWASMGERERRKVNARIERDFWSA